MADNVVLALDGMGGDNAPLEPVRAAILGARDGVKILLVGDEATLRAELEAMKSQKGQG